MGVRQDAMLNVFQITPQKIQRLPFETWKNHNKRISSLPLA